MAISANGQTAATSAATPTDDTLPAVSLRDVYQSFSGTEVLRGVSLDVSAGEVICIIGPSGSGKSTILRCINGLNDINSGSIRVQGQEVNDPNLDVRALRRKVGIVFQQYNLFPHMSALDNIALAPMRVANESRSAAREWAAELLNRVHLSDKADAFPGELSGGQQQRVAIARSLAMRPSIMLFDEVTAALDPQNVREVLNLIRDVAKSGVTCLIVTHEMQFAESISDQVYFTDKGVIIEHGPPDVLFTQASDARTQAFLDQTF